MDGNPIPTPQPTIAPFSFPIKGINETWARGAQPEGTCPDCQNVLPFDLTGRARGGTRPGIVRANTQTYGGGFAGSNLANAQWIDAIVVEVAASAAAAINVIRFNPAAYPPGYLDSSSVLANRVEYTVLLAAGEAYYGTSSASLTLIAGSGSHTTTTSFPTATVIDGKMYICDGGPIKSINFAVSPPVWTAYAAAKGTAPTGPTICCAYRKRLVVAGDQGSGDPENVSATRVGDQTDWDYSAADPGSAWALNASKQGQPGEPVTALIPLGDDGMILGCDRSIWLVNGDPADGGRVDVLTRGVGMVSPTGYAFDPSGNLYFVGSNGFYVINRGSYAVQDLSIGSYPIFFANPLIGVWVCAYDKDRHGIWIFRTPTPKTGGTTDHLWYDLRTQGFFRQRIPSAIGPLRARAVEHAGNLVPRELLMAGYAAAGGTFGVELYKFDPTAGTDGGTNGFNGTSAISSYVWMGPLRPSHNVSLQSCLLAQDFILGDIPTSYGATNWAVSYLLQAGRGAYEAYANPTATAGGSFSTPGRQTLQRNRLRGEAFWLKLFNGTANKVWGVEQVVAQTAPGGPVRVA